MGIKTSDSAKKIFYLINHKVHGPSMIKLLERKHKFPGVGQKFISVLTFTESLKLMHRLPKTASAEIWEYMTDIFTRLSAGDATLLNELIHNSQSDGVLQTSARNELGIDKQSNMNALSSETLPRKRKLEELEDERKAIEDKISKAKHEMDACTHLLESKKKDIRIASFTPIEMPDKNTFGGNGSMIKMMEYLQTKNESNILTLLQMFRFLAQMIHHNHYDEHEMVDQTVFFERYTGFLYYDGEVETSLMITKAHFIQMMISSDYGFAQEVHNQKKTSVYVEQSKTSQFGILYIQLVKGYRFFINWSLFKEKISIFIKENNGSHAEITAPLVKNTTSNWLVLRFLIQMSNKDHENGFQELNIATLFELYKEFLITDCENTQSDIITQPHLVFMLTSNDMAMQVEHQKQINKHIVKAKQSRMGMVYTKKGSVYRLFVNWVKMRASLGDIIKEFQQANIVKNE